MPDLTLLSDKEFEKYRQYISELHAQYEEEDYECSAELVRRMDEEDKEGEA